MKTGWSPGGALDRANPLSGSTPSDAALRRRCDQVMSQQQLAPSRADQASVSHGRDLEIPTTLWRPESRSGHELELERLDPDGCMVRTRSKTYHQENGHTSARWAAGTAAPAINREDHSSCGRCVYLTGAFLWVRATWYIISDLRFGSVGCSTRRRIAPSPRGATRGCHL